MGLAASQSRLLLLTARKNDVEAQMMTISNEKLMLSRRSAEASTQYNNAMNSQKLTWGSSSTDVSYNLLMHPNTTISSGQYLLTNSSSGAVILDAQYQSKLGLLASGSASDFKNKFPDQAAFIASCTGTSDGSTSASYNASYYANLYSALSTSGWQTNSGVSNKDTLQAQILNGNVSLSYVCNNRWEPISSSDSSYPINAEDDNKAIAKAEAQYDSDKSKLDYKESQLDVSMNDLDTERSSIETETTSVQKIIDKNIESSFKMFQNA